MLELDNETDAVTAEQEGRTVDILRADGTPWMIKDAEGKELRAAQMTVRGSFSDAFTKAQKKVERRNRMKPRGAEEREDDDNREIWAACVVSWELFIAGKQADPIDVFKRWPFVYRQVIREASDHGSFSVTE